MAKCVGLLPVALVLTAGCAVDVRAGHDAGPACDALAQYFDLVRSSDGSPAAQAEGERLVTLFRDQAEETDDAELAEAANALYSADGAAAEVGESAGADGEVVGEERSELDSAISELKAAQRPGRERV